MSNLVVMGKGLGTKKAGVAQIPVGRIAYRRGQEQEKGSVL